MDNELTGLFRQFQAHRHACPANKMPSHYGQAQKFLGKGCRRMDMYQTIHYISWDFGEKKGDFRSCMKQVVTFHYNSHIFSRYIWYLYSSFGTRLCTYILEISLLTFCVEEV